MYKKLHILLPFFLFGCNSINPITYGESINSINYNHKVGVSSDKLLSAQFLCYQKLAQTKQEKGELIIKVDNLGQKVDNLTKIINQLLNITGG